MEPDHHRPLSAARLRRPDVEHETVFALRFARIGRQHLFGLAADDLRRTAAPLECIANAGPRLRLLRWHESPGAGGRRAVGHALEGVHRVVDIAANATGTGRDGLAGRPRALA